MSLTLAELEETLRKLEKYRQKESPPLYLPACGYDSWDDAKFKEFVKAASAHGAVFIGGSACVNAFQERCKKLRLL